MMNIVKASGGNIQTEKLGNFDGSKEDGSNN
jgi:hypothetical protein